MLKEEKEYFKKIYFFYCGDIADREVPGSNPGVPLIFFRIKKKKEKVNI